MISSCCHLQEVGPHIAPYRCWGAAVSVAHSHCLFIGAWGPSWRRLMKAEAVSTALGAALQLASNTYAGLCHHDLVYKISLIVCSSTLQANGASPSTASVTSNVSWIHLRQRTKNYNILKVDRELYYVPVIWACWNGIFKWLLSKITNPAWMFLISELHRKFANLPED